MSYQPLYGAEGRLSAVIQYVRKMSRALIFLAAAGFILAILSFTKSTSLYASNTPSSPFLLGNSEPSQPSQPPTRLGPENRRFVIVMPATSPHPNLCKSMMSAIALGYPSPIVVNWGLDHRLLSKWNGGANLLKVPGVLRYLDAVLNPFAHPSEKLDDEDLVLIVDGYDAWFQLPPEVLLTRYHASNERANARLLEQWPGEEPMPMEQTIIAASQKRCFPTPEFNADLHCDKLPESPLRSNLYGPNTDTNMSDYHTVRPKFINGGVYMEKAGHMRHMFRRGYSRLQGSIDKGYKMASEQGVTGEILGEQEVWRQWKREGNVTVSEMTVLVDQDFEYHIGLDYHQEISIATVFEEEDGLIIKLNNKTGIKERSEALGISPVRLRGVPEDVRKTKNPLDGIVEAPNWGEMPLYADFFTESIPVIMHHNAHRDGLKQRRIWWWDQTWFFGYLRELLARHLKPGEQSPLATIRTKDRDITYWPVPANELRKMPRWLKDSAIRPLPQMEFKDICREPTETESSPTHWWDEIFRDGKGPFN